MAQNIIRNKYFKWLCNLVYDRDFVSYKKLLQFLFEKEFTYILPMDENRAIDGINLRYGFIKEFKYSKADLDYLDEEPCSVLEMMIALAIRCEEDIMYDPEIGNRMSYWFWGMIVNLKLDSMNDSNFNINQTNYILDRFLTRTYKRNGEGGLFTIKYPTKDLRSVEIWYQMCWYIDSIACRA